MKIIIKNPVSLAELQIAENNFPKRMNWNEAMSSAKNLGRGWRLPSVFELELIRTELYSNELDENGLNVWTVSMHEDNKETLGLDNIFFL
jgi:hypothetical protein